MIKCFWCNAEGKSHKATMFTHSAPDQSPNVYAECDDCYIKTYDRSHTVITEEEYIVYIVEKLFTAPKTTIGRLAPRS